jgi:hypothetical protein
MTGEPKQPFSQEVGTPNNPGVIELKLIHCG